MFRQAFFLMALLPVAVLANSGSFSSFTGFGQNYAYNTQGLTAKAVEAPAYAPRPVTYAPQPVAYAHQPVYSAYVYEQPKHNCSVSDVTELAKVCTPAFEKKCESVDLKIKRIVDKEFCYDVVRTVCTEKIEQGPILRNFISAEKHLADKFSACILDNFSPKIQQISIDRVLRKILI
jgi:hypothetical protein